MTRDLPRPHFHSSQLIRCLAELDLFAGAEPTSDLADGLGQWVHFTDAIALAGVHESGMASFPAQTEALRVATGTRLTAQYEQVSTAMVNAITKSCSPKGGNTPIRLPLPEPEPTYAPYRRFYEAHQRDMELSVEPLRVNLRAALATASPRLRKLAELDIATGKFLRVREAQFLARVPLLLQKRFLALHATHQQQSDASGTTDHPAAWMQPGGWLAAFCQNMQMLLLAEAELRLQPSAGLLEAFNQPRNDE